MRHRLIAAAATLLALSGLPACAQPPAAPTEQAPPLEQTPALEENPDLVRRYAETITPSDLAAHLYVFASDYFEGRETSRPGQKLAATYLAGQYRKLGLEPNGTLRPEEPYSPEAYFQPFALTESYVAQATLTAIVDGQTVLMSTYSPEAQDDLAFPAHGRSEGAEGGVLFVGYGIATDDFDELETARDAGLDATGKWVLLLDHEPLGADGRSLITEDGTPTDNTERWYMKYVRFYRAGLGRPSGYLVVSDASPLQPHPFDHQATAAAGKLGRLALAGREPERPNLPPIFHISTKAANALLRTSGRTVADLQQTIDTSLRPVVFDVAGAKVRAAIEPGRREVMTENVLALIEGSDPDLKDEVLVITSHYDHLGVDASASGDGIYNGADDDGSGVVAMLEIAEAFMEAKRDGHGPRRSILFLNVSAEEKGLLGSAYYADTEPLIPLDATVTNLNIDMIGRRDPSFTGSENYVYIIGGGLVSDDLDRISTRANDLAETGLELSERFNTKDDPNRFYARSDHWNFGKYRIPFIFYHTGDHEDYHGVGDEPDRVEYPLLTRISRLVFATAWQVANQDERPQISGRGFWDD